MRPRHRHIFQSDVALLIPAQKDRLRLALLSMDAVNRLPLLDLPASRIELQLLQNHCILIHLYGYEFEHESLGADELGQLRLAHLAGLFLKGVYSYSLLLIDNTVGDPATETGDVDVG